jgi:hypothetical protein
MVADKSGNGGAGLQRSLQFPFWFSPPFKLRLFRAPIATRPGDHVAQLAQAYIHLKPYEPSDKRMRMLGRYAKRVAVRAAADIYGGDVEIEVELEEGSLIARITLAGSLVLNTYMIVGNYKGFKDSIAAACEDAREFAVDVCDPFVEKAGADTKQVYRFERRLKAPGKIYRLTKRLDKLQKSLDSLSPNDVRKELAGLRTEWESLGSHLSQSERELLDPLLKRPHLPPPARWPQLELPKVALRTDEDQQPALFGPTTPGESDPKRRLVYRDTAVVPRKKGPRRNRHAVRSDLLS